MTDQPELKAVAAWVASELGYRNVSFCGKGSFKETFRVEGTDGSPVASSLLTGPRSTLSARIARSKP